MSAQSLLNCMDAVLFFSLHTVSFSFLLTNKKERSGLSYPVVLSMSNVPDSTLRPMGSYGQ